MCSVKSVVHPVGNSFLISHHQLLFGKKVAGFGKDIASSNFSVITATSFLGVCFFKEWLLGILWLSHI